MILILCKSDIGCIRKMLAGEPRARAGQGREEHALALASTIPLRYAPNIIFIMILINFEEMRGGGGRRGEGPKGRSAWLPARGRAWSLVEDQHPEVRTANEERTEGPGASPGRGRWSEIQPRGGTEKASLPSLLPLPCPRPPLTISRRIKELGIR